LKVKKKRKKIKLAQLNPLFSLIEHAFSIEHCPFGQLVSDKKGEKSYFLRSKYSFIILSYHIEILYQNNHYQELMNNQKLDNPNNYLEDV